MTIRKAIPLLWKYLMVVAMSCMLAFVISQESRAAEPSAGVATAAKAQDVRQYEKLGPYAIEVVDQAWRDNARARTLPVRIVAPVTNAADKKDSARFPVIIFSHGLGGNRLGGKYWGEHWASHGYIVVHLQHPGSDESIWQGKAPADVVTGMKSAMTMNNLGLRLGDVHFALDEIVQRARAGVGLFKSADPGKIGMSGHSFGAQTTLAVTGQSSPAVRGQSGFDKRITAAIAFSPNARNKTNLAKQFGDIRLPFFSITGSKDGAVLDDGTEVAHRILPFENMPAGDKYLTVYENGDHMVFGGHQLAGRRPQTQRDGEIQRDVKASTLAFWNAYLKNDADAKKWLGGARDGFPVTLAANDKFQTK